MATAKRLGAMQLLDRVVTEKLLSHLAANGPVRGAATALNLSLESMLDPPFVDWLYGKLNAQRNLAKYIIIEVAEHSIASHLDVVKKVFSRLRETGARLSIDRFGQNTTSLGFLRGMEVDYIKIDCEGFEYRVLQGAKETIQRCRPVVVIEQKPHDMYSKDYGQFAAIGLLEDWGMVRLDQVKDDWIMGWE